MTTRQVAAEQEEDVRLKMLDSFLTCPHRDTTELNKLYGELQSVDPSFFAHIAAWYMKNGDIRDSKMIATARLLVDEYLPNREVGLALWQRFPFFMKFKVFKFLKGTWVKIQHKTGEKMEVKKGRKTKTIDVRTVEKKRVGLDKNVPTSFVKEITRYLSWLEADNGRFDGVAAKNRNDLRELMVSLPYKHTGRTNDILFFKKYPEDSKLKAIENIAKEENPIAQAQAIVKEKIPFTTAIGLVENPTPAVWVALIDSMSPQEMITHISVIEERGLLENPDIKDLVMKKLKKAETAKGVAALKSKTAKSTGRVQNEEVTKQLDAIADKQIKKAGVIRLSTAVFVDSSSSMNKAIEVGKRVSTMVSGATEAPLTVLAFNKFASQIVAKGTTLTAWEQAFAPVKAYGRTGMGACPDFLMRNNIKVEQMVFITDEGETETPTFVTKYREYCERMKVTPSIVLIRVEDEQMVARYGRSYTLRERMKSAGIEFDLYEPKNADYYSLPGLIPMLARKTKTDLLYEIMATPLPVRKAYV